MADHRTPLARMGLVTYRPRWMPLPYLSRRSLAEWFIQWLDLIPAAISSALLLPVLALDETPRQIDVLCPELWVALPTLAFAWWRRSLGGTVVMGMLLFWLAYSMPWTQGCGAGAPGPRRKRGQQRRVRSTHLAIHLVKCVDLTLLLFPVKRHI